MVGPKFQPVVFHRIGFFRNGNHEQAAAAWEQAIQLPDTVNDLGTYADTVVHLASAYQALGHHDRALAAFPKAGRVFLPCPALLRNSGM